jgi:hypothetical protein
MEKKIQEKKNDIWTWGPFGPYLRGALEHTKLWVSLGALLKSPTSQTKELMVSCECWIITLKGHHVTIINKLRIEYEICEWL